MLPSLRSGLPKNGPLPPRASTVALIISGAMSEGDAHWFNFPQRIASNLTSDRRTASF